MKYVVYYRVSSKQQGESGLGLEAQKQAVESFLQVNKAESIPPSFTEVESGRKNNRPELLKAIERCKETGSTLLIAKLDRLARNASFILNLKDDLAKYKIGFTAVDMPDANTLTIGIMALMAQQEAEFISERTKAGLKVAKAKGIVLGAKGRYNLTDEAKRKAHETISRNAREDQSVRHAWHFIRPLREQGITYQKIADELNKEGYRTRTGKQFHAQQVLNIYRRFQALENKTQTK